MKVKPTYFIKIWEEDTPEIYGIGECNLFRGLSADDTPDYEDMLDRVCESALTDIPKYSSIIFGVETALADLAGGGKRIAYPSLWTQGKDSITINGLIWMDTKDVMLKSIKEKIDRGFRCLKLKIGNLRFQDELELLKLIRNRYSSDALEIRVDANGAFRPEEALAKIDELSKYDIHSIEQPIKAGQIEMMTLLCRESSLPIALDEELIGVRDASEKCHLLDAIRPQYIILKPALCGGFSHADEWIKTAESYNISWWATSALESNIGLNAIAQWVYTRKNNMAQGLGTGMLYENNFESPIELHNESLWYNPVKSWDKYLSKL